MKKKLLCFSIGLAAAIAVLAFIEPAKASKGFDSAIALSEGSSITTSQISISTQILPTVLPATAIVTGNEKNLAIKIINLSQNYRVAIGTSVSVSMTNGFMLNVSSSPGNTITFNAYSGSLWAFGEGNAATAPSIAVLIAQ